MFLEMQNQSEMEYARRDSFATFKTVIFLPFSMNL
jgi:hypothetical protein